MHVEMKHRLACARPNVQHRPIAMFDIALACDFCCRQMTLANGFGFFRLRFFQSGKMFLRNHQHMGWRLGVNVFEGEHMIVLINFFGGNLAAENAAEKAATVWVAHRSITMAER